MYWKLVTERFKVWPRFLLCYEIDQVHFFVSPSYEHQWSFRLTSLSTVVASTSVCYVLDVFPRNFVKIIGKAELKKRNWCEIG